MTNDNNTIEEQIDFKELLRKIKRHKIKVVISVLLSLCIAIYYLLSTPNTYSVSSSIILQEENEFEILELLNHNSSNNSTFENAGKILSSYSLTEKTLNSLDFGITYKTEKTFFTKEIYPFTEFKIIPAPASKQLFDQPITLLPLTKDSLRLKYNVELQKGNINHIDTIIKWGKLYSTEHLTFVPTRDSDLFTSIQYSFIINSTTSLVKQWRDMNITEPSSGSIIDISITHQCPEKAADFINALSHYFIMKEVSKKDLLAEKTINFLDEQLDAFKDSLKQTESALENFKYSVSAVDLQTQTEGLYSELNSLKNTEAQLAMKSKYYQYLINHLRSNEALEELVSPSAMNVNDPILIGLISELSGLINEKSQLELNTKQLTPYLKAHQHKIDELKHTILENVESIQHNTIFQKEELKKRISEFESKLNTVPKSQKEFFRIQRKFNLNEELYTFLLKKRADFQIIKASNSPENEILDPAKADLATLVSPRPKIILLFALVLGIIVPIILIVVLDMLNNKIVSHNDIEKITKQHPFLGNITNHHTKDIFLNNSEKESIIAEAFRSLRTNIQFTTNKEKGNTILITSCQAGEGKSFISSNLASCIALNNKKVLLIGSDLRRPDLHTYFKFDKKRHGLSNFLIGKQTLKQIIFKSPINNLDIISSGIIPPNPNELLASEQFDNLIEDLKKIYDYIVIDTPPIGAVSDSKLIHKHSDLNILIARSKQCPKDLFQNTLTELEKQKMGNFSILINGIDEKALSYNSYNYKEKSKSPTMNFLKMKRAR